MVLSVVEYYNGVVVVRRVLLGWNLVLAGLGHSWRVPEGRSGSARRGAVGLMETLLWMALSEADLVGGRRSDGDSGCCVGA